jgi:hypothetical protein
LRCREHTAYAHFGSPAFQTPHPVASAAPQFKFEADVLSTHVHPVFLDDEPDACEQPTEKPERPNAASCCGRPEVVTGDFTVTKCEPDGQLVLAANQVTGDDTAYKHELPPSEPLSEYQV